MTDPYVGKLAYFRVYSGVLRTGDTLQNTTKRKKERIGRILRMHADRREDLKEVHAGDIAATLGMKVTFTGETYPIQELQLSWNQLNFRNRSLPGDRA